MGDRGRWACVADVAGRAIVDRLRGHEAQVDQAWNLFRTCYAPPDVLATVDRALALVAVGFSPTSTPTDGEVNAAFKRLAVECHPDKNPSPDAAERFKVASAARDLLLRRISG